MVIAITSESRSASVRNRDRHHLGTLIAIARNTQPTPQRRAESQNLPTVALSVLAPSQARSADCCAPLFNDLLSKSSGVNADTRFISFWTTIFSRSAIPESLPLISAIFSP